MAGKQTEPPPVADTPAPASQTVPAVSPAVSPKASSPTAKSPKSPAEAGVGAQHNVDDVQDTIEADPALAGMEADGDEAYGSDTDSRASTSLSSSVRDYAFENNRRYHRFQEGRYHFPNDEPEQEREDMKHSMVVNLCGGKLHFAPLDNPQTILDIGTGTGIWPIDMGDEYPEAKILGIDLSPIQPSWVPPNVSFMVDDAEAIWLHQPSSFDYIHIRHMTSSIRDWPKLLAQAYTALKPGGWIELQELRFKVSCDDETMTEENTVKEFIENVGKGLASFGVNLLAMEKNPENVRNAGFINVDEKVYKVPIGVWPRDKKMKTVGLYNRSMIYDGLHGISMGPFTRGLKWTPEQVEMYLIGVRKALMDASVH